MKKRFWSPFSRAAIGAALLSALTPTLSAQSLWKETSSTSMVSDKRAHAIGDIITILIQESNTASKNNNTKTSKSSDLDASISSFLYSPGASSLLTKAGQLPAIKLGGKHSFDGGGTINNAEQITARIAVKVADVLPNGNLVIEGT